MEDDSKFLSDSGEATADNTEESSPSCSNGTDYESTLVITEASIEEKSSKDRGYAWVVLAASFLCQVVGVGSALSSGAFTPTLLEQYEGNRETVAWIGSIHAGLLFFAGPLAGLLTDRFGHRVVIIGGALLASCGVLLSAFSPAVWTLYITYGGMGGVGLCFTYIPAVTILPNYFEKWRHVAYAVSAAGTGIGTLILPQYIRLILELYGLQGAYILTAAVILQIVVCGALMLNNPSDESTADITTHKITLRQELSILTEWRFCLFLLNNYLFNFGSLIIFVFVSDYAVIRGLSSREGMYLISVVGVSNAVGRLLNTLLSVCKIANRTPIYIVSCSLSGVSVCLLTLPASSDSCLLMLASFCALYGVLFGVQLGNLAIVTHTLAGLQRLNTAFGVVMMLNGAGAATGPPCAGFLYRVSGSYELAFYVGGASIILAGLIMIPIVRHKKHHKYSGGEQTDPIFSDKNVGGLTIPDIQTMGSRIIASMTRLNESNNNIHTDPNSNNNCDLSKSIQLTTLPNDRLLVP